MVGNEVQINFDAPACLRKWPSLNSERLTATKHPAPYLLFDGTLDESIKKFMAKPASQHHLYEIHNAPQPPSSVPFFPANTWSNWPASGSSCLLIRLGRCPLWSALRTCVRHRAMSEECHERKSRNSITVEKC
jgi:hypothetical protein